MKVVCDTNVLVSGILFGGHARTILELISRGMLTNFLSLDILRELEDVLARPKFGLQPRQLLGIVALLNDSCEIVEPSRRIHAVADDPDDNRVLEAAKAADAEFIISGDNHLLDLRDWEGIQVLSPGDFVRKVIG